MKKLTALLLALCMVFALAACGEDAETAESAAPQRGTRRERGSQRGARRE